MCRADDEDRALELIKITSRAIIEDDDSVANTFAFIGGTMVYETNYPIDIRWLATHTLACLPARPPHFQSLLINGRRVTVRGDGTLIMHHGTSRDEMRQALLDAYDIVSAPDGDTNV